MAEKGQTCYKDLTCTLYVGNNRGNNFINFRNFRIIWHFFHIIDTLFRIIWPKISAYFSIFFLHPGLLTCISNNYSCAKQHESSFRLCFSFSSFCVTILHADVCTHTLISLFPGFRFSLGQHSRYSCTKGHE